jgi:hypothetical protein
MAKLATEFKPAALAKLDGRSREAALVRRTRGDLIAHVGGKPSATQSALIDRAVMLTLHIALLDEKTLKAGGTMTEHDSRQYLAWSNSLSRALRDLGLRGAPEKPPSLADHFASLQPGRPAGIAA